MPIEQHSIQIAHHETKLFADGQTNYYIVNQMMTLKSHKTGQNPHKKPFFEGAYFNRGANISKKYGSGIQILWGPNIPLQDPIYLPYMAKHLQGKTFTF